MPSISRSPSPSRADILVEAQGLLSQNFSRAAVSTNQALSSGQLIGALLPFKAGDVITNVHFNVSTAGTTVTLGRVGIYSRAGVLLASCANDTAIWTATASLRSVALSSSYSVPTTDGLYVMLLAVFSGTAPQISRAGNIVNLSEAVGSGSAPGAYQNGQSDLPASASFSVAREHFWIGAS